MAARSMALSIWKNLLSIGKFHVTLVALLLSVMILDGFDLFWDLLSPKLSERGAFSEAH
jgi:hypothetical protein